MGPWLNGKEQLQMKDLEILQKMKQKKICGIIRKVTAAEAQEITGALINGGVSIIEVAFNTPNAAGIIAILKKEYGDAVIIGAGTVLDTETARSAILAGADFILSPTLHIDVIRMCQKYNVLAVPGVFTPSEIIQAWEAGARIVKAFPAVTLTPTFIKQVKGPLDQIEIMAVGGINEENAADFLHAGACCVGVGSDIAGLSLLHQGGASLVSKKAQQLVERIM